MGTKIEEQKLKIPKTKSRNENFKNPGTKITKIWEQKLQNSGTKIKISKNKNYKNPGTKITKIQEQKLKKSGNKSYKYPRTKVKKT
jgi:hypothetical protein